MIPFHHYCSDGGFRRKTRIRKSAGIRMFSLFLCLIMLLGLFPTLMTVAEEKEQSIDRNNRQTGFLQEGGQSKEEGDSLCDTDLKEYPDKDHQSNADDAKKEIIGEKTQDLEESQEQGETQNPEEAQDPEESRNPGETQNPEEVQDSEESRNPEEIQNPEESQDPEEIPEQEEDRLPAVQKSILAADEPDAEAVFSEIVNFDDIALYYAGDDGQPDGDALRDGVLIEKNRQLALRYGYRITEEQCKRITAGTRYYLDISSHLILPPDLTGGSPLTIAVEGGAKEQFGMIYADGSRAWVIFDAKADGGTVLSEYGSLENAYFYLNCHRADDPPAGEKPVEGQSNLYVLKYENNKQIQFGYAEKEPLTAKAEIKKEGALQDRTITWTIAYTPWQNPSAGDGVTMDSAFELRDRIDTSLHSYVDGSATIDGISVQDYPSRDKIPSDKLPDAYVIVEADASGTGTTLTFGGAKLNAGKATQGDQVQSLEITYRTSVNEDLLLPGDDGKKQVTNAAGLFAGENGIFNDMKISGGSSVAVPQPVWLEKTGTTTRHTDGTGSTTAWKVRFYPNGLSVGGLTELTLHDQLPEGSTLDPDSVKVDGQKAAAATDGSNGFTISPIAVTDGSKPVSITYQTHVPEKMYDTGTNLGDNTAWFTFKYNGTDYSTPKATTPVGSGDGSGKPGTATLVKTNERYNASARTIEWTVQINPHKAYFKSGTFEDRLGDVGDSCGKSGHGRGLELVDIYVLVDDKTPGQEDWQKIHLTHDPQRQILGIIVGEIGPKSVTIKYITKVCDPCLFANNTVKAELKNEISTDDMIIGRNETEGRGTSADSTAVVSAAVLSKKAPVYDYETGRLKWTVVVNESGIPMKGVVLEDSLPAGLTYVEDSFTKDPEDPKAAVSINGQDLTINLGEVSNETTITFETEVDPEVLGFGGDKPVSVENTIRMNGEADGVTFVEVSHGVKQDLANHGLVKNSNVNNRQEWIEYEVLINPLGLALPGNPVVVDTLDKRLQLDQDTLRLYQASVSGSLTSAGEKPVYKKEGSGQPLKVTGYDPAANSFTVRLPVQADSRNAYLLTYTADIIDRQAGGYGNSVRFDGGNVQLGGSKSNSAAVSGGGGGGGGGVAARKAGITVIKKDAEDQKPLAGVTFTLYQWDESSARRGLAFAQGVTDAQGMLSFKVKPGGVYELVETESAPGYSNVYKWESLPGGVTATDTGLLITAGAAKSELRLELTNEVRTSRPEEGGGGGTSVNPGGSDNFANSGNFGLHDSSAGINTFGSSANSNSGDSGRSGASAGFGVLIGMGTAADNGVLGEDDEQGEGNHAGALNIPQTGDNTPWLIAFVSVSGILLGIMTLHRFLQTSEEKSRKIFRFFYMAVLSVFAVFGTVLVIRLIELRHGDNFYKQVRETDSFAIEDAEPEAQEEQESDLTRLQDHLARFAAEYPETMAWLQLPDTEMDYPVMAGRDNQFYLEHLPDGSRNAMGSLFLDCRVDKESPHLIIYGHNGLGGNMFGLLKQYESSEYFAEHRTLTIAMADSVYVCPIFSVRRVQADSDSYRLNFEDQDALADYVVRAVAESLYPTDVNPDGITRVLTLSTCTGRRDQRLIVQAALPVK